MIPFAASKKQLNKQNEKNFICGCNNSDGDYNRLSRWRILR